MSLLFDGLSNVNMGFSRPFAQNVAGCTVMGWAILESATANRSVIGFFNNGTNTRTKLNVNTDFTVSVRAIAQDGDATSAFNTVGTVTPFVWTHLAGVVFFSSKSGIIYINGVANTAGVFANMTAGNTSDTPASVGRFGSGEVGTNNRWLGRLEDLRIYNRALGPAEIQSIYAGLGKDGIKNSLIVRYPCNDLGVGQAPVIVGEVASNFGGLPTGAGLVYSDGLAVSGRGRGLSAAISRR